MAFGWEDILQITKAILPTLASGAVQVGAPLLSQALAPKMSPAPVPQQFMPAPMAGATPPLGAPGEVAPKTPGTGTPGESSVGHSFTGGFTGGSPLGAAPGGAPSSGFTTLNPQRQPQRAQPAKGFEAL